MPDSIHLVTTTDNVGIFLTTDIKLIKRVERAGLSFRILNPIEFVMEVAYNEQ